MHPYKRSQRLNHLIREEVADIIMHRVKDPGIGFVTVTDVTLTPDLKLARIYVSILKEEEAAPTLKALETAKAFIRSELGKRIRTKFTPSIEFHRDTTAAYGDHITRLLKGIKPEGADDDNADDNKDQA